MMTPPAGDFNAISAGWFHSVALKKNGTIVCWGSDSWDQSTPPEGNDFVAIAAGGFHSVALRRDGSVACWGSNERSQASVPLTKIIETYSYDAFGKTTIKGPGGILRTQSAVGNRFMFTGREYDYETGNYYYRARFYSPKIGRFLQTDPISYLGGLNLYSYCGNNPTRWIDPWGLEKVPDDVRRSQLYHDQYNKLQEMLEYERQYGIGKTARRYGNTYGWDPMGPDFDNQPVYTRYGDIIDLDWFFDVKTVNPVSFWGIDPTYIFGKTLWNTLRWQWVSPYADQKEANAMRMLRRGRWLRDMFPEEWMNNNKPLAPGGNCNKNGK